MSKLILIVDDEPLIRTLFSRLLKKLGYEFLLASDGAEAIEVFEENKDDIGMVILDMVMPDYTGDQIFDMLRKMKPEVGILLSTGYTEDEKIEELLDNGNASFIQKPFTMDTLKPKIEALLPE